MLPKFLVAALALVVSFSPTVEGASQIDISGPPGSGAFGTDVKALPNGNIVVTDPNYDLSGPTVADVGAVYLYNGQTGALISVMRGSTTGDRVGQSVTILANGNFVVATQSWDGAAANVGAVTLCSGTTGCPSLVTTANSLVGSTADDSVGIVMSLPNGNYIVKAADWDGMAFNTGAVTWCSGVTGCGGMAVSAANSLVGSRQNDNVGIYQKILSNGDYVVLSRNWDSPSAANAGAATLCSGTSGCVGEISSTNSLVGGNAGDAIGTEAAELTNGNYVVFSPFWGVQDAGAVTWCSGKTGCSGLVSSANSLVGSTQDDRVGGVANLTQLANGNYLIQSDDWDGTAPNVGAVTWCQGATGCSGVVSQANSLVGSTANDRIGLTIVPLTNGNYVAGSRDWDGAAVDVGAVRWCDGTTGCFGNLSPANSLVGSTTRDAVGSVIAALSNGNYVVGSPEWTGTAARVGAVTWCSGVSGCAGVVSAANSLTGSTLNDTVGNNGIAALSNGNYVVASFFWDGSAANVGAVTWCNGTFGCNGAVSASNSLVGSSANDQVGRGVTALTNGNYVASSPLWRGTARAIGAVTLCNGAAGCTGPVSATESLVGSTQDDNIGNYSVTELTNGNYVVGSNLWNGAMPDVGALTWCSGMTGCPGMVVSAANSLVGSSPGDFGSSSVTALDDANYVFRSDGWDDPVGSILDAGAVCYGDGAGGTVGPISAERCVLGTVLFGGASMVVAYNYVNRDLVVGRPRSNIVSIFRPSSSHHTSFDFDGDARADVSVFRPGDGAWYLLPSRGGFNGISFGLATDKIAPSDFDGDGKTDVAVYRPSQSTWYWLNSSTGTLSAVQFGSAEDLPTPADYDGDGRADVSVFRPSNGVWYRLNSSNGSFYAVQFGASDDKPTIGDYDGDGLADVAVFRPSTGAWYRLNSSDGQFIGVSFGLSTDLITPADFDGDAKTDVAVYRPSNGTWFWLNSTNGGLSAVPFGTSEDVPVAADFDGDGRADVSVFRPSNGVWYRLNSGNGQFFAVQFGISTDRPTPAAFRY